MIKQLWNRLVAPLDPPLLGVTAFLLAYAFLVLFSATSEFPHRMNNHLINLTAALVVMRVVAGQPPQRLMSLAVPIYVVGLLLLIAVALVGDVSKGARRWLNLGFMRIQPSELMKIAMPMMLAWYFQQREASLGWREYALSALILAVPVGLIARQPDLGTAILVLAAGVYVIFFAGLSWKVIGAMLAAGLGSLPLLWMYVLHGYQKQRVLTLLDPEADPLGKGFHIIQSTIAVGSGGLVGKGWMEGTQSHLEFVPERHTDFILAVLSEEFGLIGNLVLVGAYSLLIIRGLMIAANASTLFSRLLAGSLTLVFFTYAFVNMGMVSGILPVVGVPLPLVSYGGTALVTLCIGLGILMSIQHSRTWVKK